MITLRDKKCGHRGIIQTEAQKRELIRLHDSFRKEPAWAGGDWSSAQLTSTNNKQTKEIENSMPTNKKTAKVRDLKPSKDAKGGSRRHLDSRSTAGRSTAGRSTAGRTVAGRTLH